MPILLEMNLSGGIVFEDTNGYTWEDTDGYTWEDGIIVLASTEDFAGTRWWEGVIQGMIPPCFKMDKAYGGYCRMGFGAVTFSPAVFDLPAYWPPPINFQAVFYFTETNDTAKQILFSGTAHRRELNRESVSYELFGEQYDTDLLEEAVDYDGETVPLPRTFGSVTYQKVVRLPDAGGQPTYHKAYVSGTKGTNWHVYGDGVPVDANVTDNGSSFSLSVSPVGEITISGTGSQTTLSGIFSWAAGQLRLSYDSSVAQSPSPAVSFFADSQSVLIEFLSEIASTLTHLFFIRSDTLYLVDMETDNGDCSLTESDILPSDYSDEPPVSLIRTGWTVRKAVEETVGKYVKDFPNEAVSKSPYPYGEELSLRPFHTNRSNILTTQARVLSVIHRHRGNISIPMQGILPVPGEAISYTDESLLRATTVSIRTRDISYDFSGEKIIVEGEGTLT